MQLNIIGEWFMAAIELHPDFKDFLRLLNSHGVEYLVVGGYAVGYYGYPRATGDMDIWIAINEVNAERVAQVLREFGMPELQATKQLFIEKDKIIRMGIPPVRIELITGASGVAFDECYARREIVEIDDIPVNFISLDDLKLNKRAAGRHKDLEDIEHLP
jgi:predicted nucleotidyltransferase